MENRQISFKTDLVKGLETGQELLQFTIPGHSEWYYLTSLDGKATHSTTSERIQHLGQFTIPHPADPTAPLVVPQETLNLIKRQIEALNSVDLDRDTPSCEMYGVYDD
jgi:hypothetical protein